MQKISSYFNPINNQKGKENDRNISLQPRVDPKKAQLKKKSEISEETVQEKNVNQKKAMNKKSGVKDDILDNMSNKFLNSNEAKRKGNHQKENSRDSTPIKSSKKKDTEMEIEEVTPNFGLKVGNKNSLLKQKKGSTPIKISSDEKVDDDDVVVEIQEVPASGIKKKKLTKLSAQQEKQKANVKPTRREKQIMLVHSNTEESEESESEEDSIKGDVEYVDDEIDHLQQNKRVDKMFQNKLEFKENKKKQEPQVDQQSVLQSYLQQQQQQTVQDPSTIQIQKNLEMISLNEEDSDNNSDNNSDLEEIRRIEEMQKQRLLEPEEYQKPIIISDSPVKNRKVVYKEDEFDMEEEIVDDKANQIINVDETSSSEDTPATFQDKKFFIVGDFNSIDKRILTLAIQENQGQVVTIPGNKEGHYNVLGEKNINKNQKDGLVNKKVPITQAGEFIQLLETTLKMSITQINDKYKQIKSQRDSLEQENKEKNQKPQLPQIPTKMTTSQQINAQTQKIEEKPHQPQQKKQQDQNQSLSSCLSSFLPISYNSSQAKAQEQELDDSIEIISENSKNISQSEVIQSKPFFTKDKLKTNKSQPITIIDDDMKNSDKMEVEVKPPVKNVNQPFRPPVKTIHEPVKTMRAEPTPFDENLSSLWTHKYAPKELKDCVGNDSVIRKMEGWLQNWENVVIHKQKAQGNWKENPGSRACLVSGPPGIGKTSTVRLLAQKYNMNIIEWNASDVRNKNAIESIINPLKDNQVLNFQKTPSTQRSIILMDEVDGMSSGDIGGNQALIKIIKETKNPIFCVCNDRYSQKLRSLSNSCFDVRFYKPNKSQVAKRLQDICQREGLKADFSTLELLAESVNNDIRQSLNLLQMQSKKSKEITFKILMQGLSSFKKDEQVTMSPFEAAKVLMTKVDFDRKTLPQKLDLFFLDYELVPMLIHENYLATITTQRFNDANISELEKMVDATQAMAESDLLGDCIRSGGNWSLLQNQGFLTSIYVPDKVCSKNTAYPQMSQYLGKFSSQRKTSRLIRELRMKLSITTSGNRQAVQFDYVQPLMEIIMHQLETNGKDGVENVVDIMENYNISPDLLKEHLIVLQYKTDIENRLKAIPTALKTQLTRSYNKRFKDDIKPEKKTKKTDDEQHVKYDDVLGEVEDAELDEEEDNIKNEEEETNDNSESMKLSQASIKSQPQKTKAQSAKNIKETQKETKKETQQKNQIKSLFTKGKK